MSLRHGYQPGFWEGSTFDYLCFKPDLFIVELQQSFTLVTLSSVALLNSSIFASATVSRQINIFSYVLDAVLQLITTQATQFHISAHRIISSFPIIIVVTFLYVSDAFLQTDHSVSS
jgi:hypothetical protein